jgi:hypothetical protein
MGQRLRSYQPGQPGDRSADAIVAHCSGYVAANVADVAGPTTSNTIIAIAILILCG